MNIDPNAPAYPYTQNYGHTIVAKGLNIRAEIASRLLAGLYASPESPDQDIAVRWAISGADALIAELNKPVEITA